MSFDIIIHNGTTTCCDGYFFEDEVAEAVLDYS